MAIEIPLDGAKTEFLQTAKQTNQNKQSLISLQYTYTAIFLQKSFSKIQKMP